MKIARDEEKERWLLDRVKGWLNRHPRSGIHVSDLLYPRKTYWRRVDPKPMTDVEAGYFIAGQGHHFIVEAIIEGDKKGKGADAGTHEWEGIYYSPDSRLQLDPTEFKTSRAKYGPKNDDEETLLKEYVLYLKQLFPYMAIEGRTKGNLIILYLNLKNKELNKTVPQFRWYTVELTPEEIEQWRTKLKIAKARLETAIAANDHKALPLCPPFMCIDCLWKKKCDPKNTDPKKEKEVKA